MIEQGKFFGVREPVLLSQLPKNRAGVKERITELRQDLFARKISGEDFFKNSIFLFGCLAQGGDNPDLVADEVANFLNSQEIQEAYQTGLVGEPLEGGLLLSIPKRTIEKGEKKARDFWRLKTKPLLIGLPEQALLPIEEIVFSEEKARGVMAGIAFHPKLTKLKYPLGEMAIGLSSLTSLRSYLKKTAEEIIGKRINITVPKMTPGQYCQNHFPAELFYILGLSQRIDHQINNIGQEKLGEDFALVRGILSAILFAKTKGVTPPVSQPEFHRFISTQKVFEHLNQGEVAAAQVELETVITQCPWYFHQHDVDAVYGSGRINLEELRERANVKLKKGEVTKVPPTGIKADMALFRENIGQDAEGTVVAWWEPGKEADSSEPDRYFFMVTDPEGPSRLKRTPKIKVIEVCLKEEEGSQQWTARHLQISLQVFVGTYLEQGELVVLGKRKELLEMGSLPDSLKAVLQLIDKTLRQEKND